MVNNQNNENIPYDENTVTVLKGLEAVRRRPGFYVGGTDLKALHHLVYEVVDNSIDEALAGSCTEIAIIIYRDGAVTVTDNGRGIPVGIHPTEKISTLQVVLTQLNAGGKFGGGGYKVSGGLHGVGVSAVNALSQDMQAEVIRDGYLWRQCYKQGVPTTEVERVEKVDGTGTAIYFVPDPEIFPDTTFRFETLANRFREMAFVTRGVTIHLRDERVEPFPREMSFYFEGGISSFVRYLNRNRKPTHDVIYGSQIFEVTEPRPARIEVEVALQYADYFAESILAFANTIHTPDGGTHLEGVRAAVTRAINFYAKKAGVLKESDPSFTGEDTYEGLTAIVSVKHPEPQFESQTKVKLLNPEVKGLVQTVVNQVFGEFLQTNPRGAREIYEKCLISSRARIASRRARDLIRSSPLQSTTLPGKLADCSSTDSTQSEIYIVEGDSAGGCFDGDTLVALADGRALSFKEIIAEQAEGKEHFCYTIREDGKIGLERILHPRMTREQAEVVRITLDNGETLICTPDHPFMLRDGNYRPAASLTSGDSLMPLYRKLSDRQQPGITISGYEMVWDPRSDSWLFTHMLADWYNQRTDVCSALPSQVHEAVANYNHKVVSVEHLSERRDVYDIEVPNSHNFALASGVFVHNSAKQGRDRHFQAILPLRGKILNTERARLDKILDNKEVQSLIAALGVGISDEFDLSRLRYGRIIIMTDADVDGAHIRTLLLTFFFRYMPDLIKEGHLYIAQPPLYLLKGGKKLVYAYSDDQKDALSKEWGGKIEIQRYKGLGEMNPGQLWETTMDPATRTLLQVMIEDAAAADRTFDMLMGSSVPPRRTFITTHARSVRNLDV